jgi:hypothetical protein
VSQEHQHEHVERSEQDRAELDSAAQEQFESLRHHETHENDADRRAEAAREIIHKKEPEPEPSAKAEKEAAPKPAHHPLLHHKINYAQTMASLQRHLTPASRAFSRVIHTPVVEKTSEALEKSVARPSVVAGATWTALIVGGGFYFTARHFGYMLSGSELLFSFVLGALIGLMIEGAWGVLKRR